MHPRLSWRIRIAYGVGQLAEGIKNCAFGTFLLFYYVSVLGMSGALTGLAILIALCFDGVTDPLMGSISDTFKSRWGRRHPFMYGAALPFAISFYLLFSPPHGLGPAQLFAWLTVFAVLTRGFMTIYSVPHMALTAELSNDYQERTTLSSIRSFFSLFGYLCVIAGGFFYFFHRTPEFSNGQLNPDAYPGFALAFSIAMVLSIWLSALGTHSEIPRLRQADDNAPPFSVRRIINQVGDALRIDDFRIVIGAGLLYSGLTGTIAASNLYIFTYFWQLTTREIGVVMPMNIIGAMIGALMARQLTSMIGDKRTTFISSTIWFAAFISGPVILRLVNILPENGHVSVLLFLATTTFLAATSLGVSISIAASMVADVTDEHELVYHTRQEGIYYGAVSLMGKVASGMGAFMAGIALDVSGLGDKANIAINNPNASYSYGLMWVFFVLIVGVIIVLVMRPYKLDQARHVEILKQLEQR